MSSTPTTAAATPSKNPSATGNNNSNNDKNESKLTTTEETTQQNCSICSTEPVSKLIVKDLNYQTLIKCYFDVLEIDVKPAEIAAQSVCTSCFESLVEFYDTNDVLVMMETQLKSLSRSLINTTVKGIKGLEGQGKPLLPLHKRILEVHPVVKEEESENGADSEKNGKGSIKTYLENPKHNKSSKPGPSSSKTVSSSDTPTKPRPVPGSKRKHDSGTSDSSLTAAPSSSSPASVANRRVTRTKLNKPKYAVDNDESDIDGSSDNDTVSRNGETTEAVDDDNDNEGNTNKCKICLEVFPNMTEFNKHLREHHTTAKNKFQCPTCKKIFVKVKELIEHKRGCPPKRGGK